MPTLEHVVRPNVAADIRPSSPVIAPPAPDVSDNILEWGGPGNSIFTYLSEAGFELETVNQQTETKRTYDTIRIKNKDDEQQYVDVAAPTKSLVRSTKGAQTETSYIPYDRAYPKTDDNNYEVIKRGQEAKG